MNQATEIFINEIAWSC